MSEPVTVEMLQRAALQQIVGEFVTLFHLALLGVAGLLLYMKWKARREKRIKQLHSCPDSSGEFLTAEQIEALSKSMKPQNNDIQCDSCKHCGGVLYQRFIDGRWMSYAHSMPGCVQWTLDPNVLRE